MKTGIDPMTEPIRMTLADFEASQAKLIKLSAEVNNLARLILVEGLPPTEAAAAVGMTKQNAYKHMKRVRALLHGLPANWVLMEAEWMPDWLAAETREKLKKEVEKIKNE
ncbi:hypothetical protein B0E42_20545 [Pseudomonas sp. A25(2017)]|uniref:TrfB-related DNA-binding protein n=1 Tax=Pseudomonas TaxID=286 RepID=UPI000985FEF9|nr:TrfB-related DNA-binding protein [Pseudomonas sp. A25(2017)]OOG83227.1 hypothetical protein B0E42_20545 [Pseudomonas sp. A25(2017)]